MLILTLRLNTDKRRIHDQLICKYLFWIDIYETAEINNAREYACRFKESKVTDDWMKSQVSGTLRVYVLCIAKETMSEENYNGKGVFHSWNK